MTVEISRLFYYPIKGARRVELDRAEITEQGIAGDREYMLVDGTDEMVSQRELRPMATLDPAAVLAACHPTDRVRDVRVFRWTGRGVDQGDDAAEVASQQIGFRVRVVRFPTDETRRTSMGGGTLKYADGYPLTIASERSLDELNSWLEQPVPIERFRPSIVLRGLSEPFVEDDIASLRVGDVTIDLIRPTGRCLVTTIDQDTAVKGKEPLYSLARRRALPAYGGGQEAMFSVNSVPRTTGEIRVGDTVEVTMHDTPYVERVARSAVE